MFKLDPRDLCKPLSDKMLLRTRSGCRIADSRSLFGHTDQFGDRAHTERWMSSEDLREYVTATHAFANLPCFLIFDSQFQQRLSFADRPPGSPIPEWVARGSSIAELASVLGIDAAGLARTIERFNGFARNGVDEDFRRGQRHWSVGSPLKRPDMLNASLGSLAVAPYYGIELHPSAFASAGLVANTHAQVMHQRRGPIAGLYAVGNAAAHTEYGVGYQAGHSLTSGMTFGYLAVLHMRDMTSTR